MNVRLCRPFSRRPGFDFYGAVLECGMVKRSNKGGATNVERALTPIYSSTPVTARADREAASTMKTSPNLVPKSKTVSGVDDIAAFWGERAKENPQLWKQLVLI